MHTIRVKEQNISRSDTQQIAVAVEKYYQIGQVLQVFHLVKMNLLPPCSNAN